MGWEVGESLKTEQTYVYLWLIHVDVWQKPAQCCKLIILQLKIKKEYWRRLPLPPPGNLPDTGNEPKSPVSPALADRFSTTESPEKQERHLATVKSPFRGQRYQGVIT